MSYGFVSNARTFFKFTGNVLHEKIKFGKNIDTFKEKIENLVDYYPFYLIMDLLEIILKIIGL